MFPSLPSVPSLLSLSGIVVILVSACFITFSLLLMLLGISIFYMIRDFFHQNPQIHESDIESGEDQESYQADDNVELHEQTSFYQAAVLHNMRVMEILDRVIEELEERKERRKRQERKRVLKKNLPPTISYGSHESDILMKCKDCAICLDEFETGELCQALPSCSHAFHSKCINNRFRENLTCPVCRQCNV